MANHPISAQDLAGADLFTGLPVPVLELVAAAARPRQLSRGTRLFGQGDEGLRLHLVIRGAVRISQTAPDGAQLVVRFIGPGEIAGMVAPFTDGCYPADATALTDCVEASWSEGELMDLMARYPPIAVNAMRIIGRRLEEMQNRMREIATQRAEQRLAHALMRLADQSGARTAAGTAIGFPLRRRDVADLAGVTLHTASRTLAGWAKAGLLVSHCRHLTICNMLALSRAAEAAADTFRSPSELLARPYRGGRAPECSPAATDVAG